MNIQLSTNFNTLVECCVFKSSSSKIHCKLIELSSCLPSEKIVNIQQAAEERPYTGPGPWPHILGAHIFNSSQVLYKCYRTDLSLKFCILES